MSDGLEGVIAAHTVMSDVDGAAGRLTLRGASLDDLAGRTTFEALVLRLFEGFFDGLPDLEGLTLALGKARAEVGANRAVLGKCSVAAPFAGRVAEQKVREQQYVQPGQALLDIIDDSVLELEFLVPSRWLAWLRSGGRFEVHIDETRKSYPARFIRIGARVDPVSQSVKVAAAIDGKFPELIAGMSGRVQITVPASDPAAPSH